MKSILALLCAFAASACSGGGDPCVKLKTDICGKGDAACEGWVAKELLEGKADAETCGFLTKDADYQKWLNAAKAKRAKAAKK